MKISLDQIKELRKRTGAGMHQVKEALENSDGDMEKAILYLREKGIAKAAKRSDRDAANGIIATYLHQDKSLAVIVELNSETDFAAKSETFAELAKNIAIHIAATDPQYATVDDIPAEALEKEKKVYEKDVKGKPENVQEKILEGKMQKFYEEIVLLEQKYVKDDTKRIKDIINDAVSAIGEKIEVGRFARIKVGGAGTAGGFNQE